MRFDPVPPGSYPDLRFGPYRSTAKRGPLQPGLRVQEPAAFRPSVAVPAGLIQPVDADLTVRGQGAPLGEKIVVSGRVTDEDGRAVRHSLVEVWQCNAAGRYWHKKDQHDAPLDPNFYGYGKFLTDGEGRYRFVTIRPALIPGATTTRRGGPRTSTSRCSAT